VLLASLGDADGHLGLFMLADSVVWLFVARGVQGLATGPRARRRQRRAARSPSPPRPGRRRAHERRRQRRRDGLGVLVSSALVELAPAPRVLPYVVLLILFAVALAGALAMPEPVAERGRLRLTPQRPGVPAGVRRQFLLASLGVISSWSIGGLFLSLGPQLAADVFHSSDHFVTGIGMFVLAGSGALAQVLFGRAAPWLCASLGSLALSAGMILIVLSASEESAVLYLAGAVIGGAGFGVAFLGGLRVLSGVIPPAHRGQVMSAFYIVAYSAISIPAVLAGIAVTPLGLQETFEIFGSIVAAPRAGGRRRGDAPPPEGGPTSGVGRSRAAACTRRATSGAVRISACRSRGASTSMRSGAVAVTVGRARVAEARAPVERGELAEEVAGRSPRMWAPSISTSAAPETIT
jgi:MFS family permease